MRGTDKKSVLFLCHSLFTYVMERGKKQMQKKKNAVTVKYGIKNTGRKNLSFGFYLCNNKKFF